MLFLTPNPVMFIFLKGTVRMKWFSWYLLFDREILLSFMMVGTHLQINSLQVRNF